MASTRTLTVRFVGDERDLRRSFDVAERDAAKAGTGIVGRFKASFSSLSGFGSAIAGGLIGGGVVAGFTGLQSAISGVVGEYQESIKIGRETARVIKTTGGAANVTAGYVEKLSEKLSEKRGIDDEVIQGGANLLLTFTRVRDEVGKGNDIYTQAVKLSGDMATSMGMSQSAAAKQLGKALNDPVKGITALSRAGVSFTEEQRTQIKVLAESGDILGAQKIILGELRTEFAGAAEAAATPLDKLKVKLANFQERVGFGFANLVTQIAPGVESAVAFVQKKWPEIEAAISRGMATVRETIEPVIAILTTLWRNFGDNILNYVRNVWGPIQQTIAGALEFIRGVFTLVLAIIRGDWSAAWDAIKQIVSGAWDAIIGVVRVAIEMVQLILGVAWEIIINAASAAWDAIKSLIASGVDAVVGFVASLPGRIGALAGAMFFAGVSLGGAVVDGIKAGAQNAAGFAIDIAGAILDAFKKGWNSVARAINEFIPDQIGFDTPFGFLGVNLPDNPLPRFHSGIASVPGPPGSEMLAILQAGERVIPASQNRTVGGAAGGNSYSIVVQVAPGADLARAGAEMIEAIKAYERHNGKVWEPA